MDGQKGEPLNPTAAKQQLRAAAARLGLGYWVRRQPFGAIASGVITGFLLGRVPRLWSRLSHSRVGQKMIDRLV